MHNTKNKPQGFTIIEVLSVVAIIGITASLAIPAYNDYTIKARTAELLNVAAAAKATVAEYRVSNGAMPSNNDDVTLDNIDSQFVRAIDIQPNGVINITANQTALGISSELEFQLNPTYATGTVDWTCTATGDPRYVPSSCTFMESDDVGDNDEPGISDLRQQRQQLQQQRRDLQSQRRDLQRERRQLQRERRRSNDPQRRQELRQQEQGIRAQERDLTQQIRDTNQEIRSTNQQIRDLRQQQRQGG